MKFIEMKSNIFKSLLLLFAVIIGTTACDDKGYWEPFNPEGQQYSFVRKEVVKDFPLTSDVAERFVDVKIRRADCTEEVTLPLTVTKDPTGNYNVEDMFDYPQSVTFAAGEYETLIHIAYKGTRRNIQYTAVIAFDENVVSPGGFNKCNVKCKLTR